jgi:transposase-like protein
MARSRRRFSAEFKARLALEAIKGQRTATELAGEHKVHPNQITTWKKQLLDVLPGVPRLSHEDQRVKRQPQARCNKARRARPSNHLAFGSIIAR